MNVFSLLLYYIKKNNFFKKSNILYIGASIIWPSIIQIMEMTLPLEYFKLSSVYKCMGFVYPNFSVTSVLRYVV